jgi:hypothetical protein
MTEHPHEPDELEPDPSVPPRPEEEVADAARETRADSGADAGTDAGADPAAEPVAGGDDDGPPAQGEGRPDSH